MTFNNKSLAIIIGLISVGIMAYLVKGLAQPCNGSYEFSLKELSFKCTQSHENKETVVDNIKLPAYVILDSAWKTMQEAQRRMVTLSHNGYSNSGHFWIPNFKFLSGKELHQVYIGPFHELTDAKSEICKYNNKFNTNTYGVKLSLESGRIEFHCN